MHHAILENAVFRVMSQPVLSEGQVFWDRHNLSCPENEWLRIKRTRRKIFTTTKCLITHFLIVLVTLSDNEAEEEGTLSISARTLT